MSASDAVEAIGIGVPARDESGSVAQCIAALDVAARRATTRVHLVVVADGCADDTAHRARRSIAAATALTGRVVETGPRGVGAARTLALDLALADLGEDPARVWLASTDADTCVASSWLVAQARWAAAGHDGVTGLVTVAWDDPDGPIARRYRPSLAPLGLGVGHHHVHGANLGVRASWWQAVGGCGEGGCHEDHELWRRLRRAGARLIGVDDVAVTTSGRLSGRVDGGFAGYLRALADPDAVTVGAAGQ